MLVTIENGHKLSKLSAPLFSKSGRKIYTASGRPDQTQAWWEVVVRADGHKIVRDVSFAGKPWDPETEGWEAEGVIWPAWPARSEDQAALADSPLACAQQYWAEVGSRLRDSAKWMATVLGAALAAIVGTSPLTIFTKQHPTRTTIVVGLIGVAFLFFTLFLVLQVMRPQSVSYADVQSARRPWQESLSKWRKNRRVGGGPVSALRRQMPDQPAPVHDHRRGDTRGAGPCTGKRPRRANQPDTLPGPGRALRSARRASHRMRQDRYRRRVLQASGTKHPRHLRWSPVRPDRHHSHRHGFRLALPLTPCPAGSSARSAA
jgi:hypothetical protein